MPGTAGLVAPRPYLTDFEMFAPARLRSVSVESSGTGLALLRLVSTDRLETSGIALLGTSIVLLLVAWIAAASAAPPTLVDDRVEVSRVIEIAIRARAAGRPEQADVLLKSLVARTLPSGRTRGDFPDEVLRAFERFASPAWASTAGAVCGALGLLAVTETARRRRASIRLIVTQLGQTSRCDDPRALAAGLARLRAERLTAQVQLHKAIERLDAATLQVPAPLRESGGDDSRMDESYDAAVDQLDAYGRILEITPIESKRSG